MTDEPSYAESKRLLIERLTANGWTRTESSQTLGWANLVLDTSRAKLEVEHMSDWWMVNLILRADDVTRRVEAEAGERVERFLKLLVLRQHELSLESWDSFVDELRGAGCIPGSFSTFVLEMATGGKSPLDHAFVYGEIDPVLDELANVIGPSCFPLTRTFHIWIIHHGVLVRGVDVYPMLSVRLKDGTHLSLATEENRDRADAVSANVVEMTVDRSALSSACGGPLPAPVLEGSRLVALRFNAERPDPDSPSNLEEGLRLHRGYNDLAGRVDMEEVRGAEKGDATSTSLQGLPEGLDELDPDFSPEELRARGWEL